MKTRPDQGGVKTEVTEIESEKSSCSEPSIKELQAELDSVRQNLEATKAALEIEKFEKSQMAMEKAKIESDFEQFRKELAKSQVNRLKRALYGF